MIAREAQNHSRDYGIRLIATPDAAAYYEKLGFERQAATGAEIPFYLPADKTAELALEPIVNAVHEVIFTKDALTGNN